MRYLFALFLMLFITVGAEAAPVRYALDTAKSRVGFIFSLNNTKARGSMPVVSSQIAIDLSALQRSSVDVTVNVRKARTGLIFATDALKSPSVLNAQRFGTVRFRSTRVRLNGQGRLADGAKIDGELTIRGVTRPVTLNAALFRPKSAAPGDLSRLNFRLSGAVSRKAFGATGFPDLVDDTIQLDIVAWVNR